MVEMQNMSINSNNNSFKYVHHHITKPHCGEHTQLWLASGSGIKVIQAWYIRVNFSLFSSTHNHLISCIIRCSTLVVLVRWTRLHLCAHYSIVPISTCIMSIATLFHVDNPRFYQATINHNTHTACILTTRLTVTIVLLFNSWKNFVQCTVRTLQCSALSIIVRFNHWTAALSTLSTFHHRAAWAAVYQVLELICISCI